MGLLGSLEWVNDYGKKRCKSLFWRVRARVRKAFKDGINQKKQLRFQYDPSSYALNFDDGCCHNNTGPDGAKKKTVRLRDAGVQQFYTDVSNNKTWVYVVWLKTK